MASAGAVTSAMVLQVLSAAVAVSGLPAINVTTMAFEEGYTPLFGQDNILRSADDRTVSLLLDRSTGSGFISSSMYQHGFFSASIKLPSDYTAGVVVAFYTSNGDVFEKRHDELDFEFLGNIRGKPWRVQTNVYGNGSVSRGREERYVLPFDPTTEFHRYSILWTTSAVAFYVDDIPVREVRRSAAMGGDFPSKPMSLYATVWDASTWATSGGRYRVNYRYGPFVASFTDLALVGCPVGPIQMVSAADTERCAAAEEALRASEPAVMTVEKQQEMRRFREHNMVYSYCYDTLRYPVPFPECDVVESERRRFKDSGHLRFALRRQQRRRGRGAGRAVNKQAADM
ncbi:probable xyloglucan endotransglucosylase/hydrolase protein 30 [Phragmites australis]|uniref:probable xyloglucan endotransglucosylase/hydrolase protein 30 n=1 Tax=Phragmites australis TaxID=29695 RepID=UPI002D76B8C1|nr:probable xyloglucan endotransglucosylase/hydrolase protein 30 [Phragmites australis]